MGTDFRKVPQHSKRNCGLKDFLSSLFYLSKSSMHNELWGSAEIMANFFETIVFANMLQPLTEAFLTFFLGLLLPPIQFALRLKKF